jgi:tetratricopeptide (TPR) repeat protein
MARRTLATLEEQAAGYTVLTIPASLVNEIEAKRQEIARLESLLAGDGGETLAHNLPRRAPFFGREKEIARAMDALSPEDRGWGLMVDGIGGIGKTALAVEVAYLCYEGARFDAIFFTTAKQTRLAPGGEQPLLDSAPNLDAMLSEIARALGETGVAQLAAADKRRGLLNALRRYSGPQRRVLLILDNLETLPGAELLPLFEFLRRLPQQCKAIVTSRRRAGEGAVWLRLERLEWAAARQLIHDEMGRAAGLARALTQTGESRWQELYDATGGSPLALHWTLGLMRVRNLSLDRALELLRDRSADSPLHQFVYREARREMGENDWRVLGALSFFAAPASFEALTSVTDLTRLALDSALERLDAYALVDVAGPDGPYALHPLTRQLAADELTGQPEAVHTLRTRFARYWVDYAERYGGDDKDAYQTFDRLAAEWPNLEAAANLMMDEGRWTKDEEAARMLNHLAHALCGERGPLFFWGFWDEGVHLSEGAYRAMAALEAWWDAGWHAHRVAWIHIFRAKTDHAAAWAERCAEAWERGGTRRDQAVATRLRGLVAESRGDLADLDDVERLYTDALAVFRDLGELAWERRAYDRAEAYYREALAIDEKRGDKEGQVIRFGNMGELALERGWPNEARQWFERALPLAQEVGRQELVAQAQWGLGRVLEEEDRPAEALPLAEAALQIRERVRDRNLEGTRQLVARLREKIGE